MTGRRQYRNVTAHRGDADREGDEESKHELRTLEPYIEGVKKNTQFFSEINPQNLLGEIQGYFNDKNFKVDIDPKRYKLKVLLEEQKKEEEATT